MYIEQISESKIKVTVDAEDQEKYGITYETMDYEDANTRRLCEKIISEAQSEIGFDSRNSRILVEARNGSKGNITIFISKIPKSLDDGYECMFQIMRFETIDYLLDSRKVFASFSESIIRKEIYEDGGEFFLYIEVEGLPSTAKKLILALNEFGEPCHIRREYLREHGNLLAKDPPIFG